MVVSCLSCAEAPHLSENFRSLLLANNQTYPANLQKLCLTVEEMPKGMLLTMAGLFAMQSHSFQTN